MPRVHPVWTGAERGRRVATRITTHVALTFDSGQNEGRYHFPTGAIPADATVVRALLHQGQ